MAREARGGLGIGDRLVLLVAWITTCGLVYLLGFYVGKGTQERRLGVEERVVRLPVTSAPPPEGQRAKAKSEFDFYHTLMDKPGTERPGAKGRDEAKSPPPTPVPPVVAAKPAPPAAARPAHTTADAAPKPPAGKPSAVVPASPPAAPVVATKAAPVPPPLPAINTATAAPAAGGWTVLANPTRSRDEADGLTRQLRGKGYDATLVRVLRDGDTWYRVQVGRFTTSDQATEMMHRLREHEGVEHAFVASE
jgi:cell division protein FtsN